MGYNFYINWLVCGLLLYFVDCSDETCYGCQLFNIREKEQKSRRAIVSECPRQCNCPPKQLDCQDGVPKIFDGCGCCYMCARQYGDTCSIVDRCDEDKGLYCEMASNKLQGICRARIPKTCVVNGKEYKDGESFYLDCRHDYLRGIPNGCCRNRCTCQNGHYGCVDLCPQENRKPSATFCPNPTLVVVRGQCCREWSCPAQNKSESNKMPRHVKNDYNLRPQNNPRWDATDDRHTNEVISLGNLDCSMNGTKWSQCSVSCGVGISVRLAPKHCRRKDDTRLCYLRPCGSTLYSYGRKNPCTPTTRLRRRENIQYKNCKSVRGYKLKFCTNCRDNQCCYPKRTKTREIEFLCNDGRYEYYKYAWIKRCTCSRRCKTDTVNL